MTYHHTGLPCWTNLISKTGPFRLDSPPVARAPRVHVHAYLATSAPSCVKFPSRHVALLDELGCQSAIDVVVELVSHFSGTIFKYLKKRYGDLPSSVGLCISLHSGDLAPSAWWLCRWCCQQAKTTSTSWYDMEWHSGSHASPGKKSQGSGHELLQCCGNKSWMLWKQTDSKFSSPDVTHRFSSVDAVNCIYVCVTCGLKAHQSECDRTSDPWLVCVLLLLMSLHQWSIFETIVMNNLIGTELSV